MIASLATHERGTSRGQGESHGFTLLELLLVVALVGLITATATLQLSKTYRRAQFRRAAEIVGEIDRQTRQLAVSQERAYALRIDLSESHFELAREEAGKEPIRVWRIIPPIRIAAAATRRERRRTGDVVIRYDRNGGSDTYAVKIASPQDETQWLMFAGLTGQSRDDIAEREVEDLLRALAKNGLNAD